MLKAIKEMNYKYVGNRPIRVLRSKWKERWGTELIASHLIVFLLRAHTPVT